MKALLMLMIVACSCTDALAATCESLKQLSLPTTVITDAMVVGPGPFRLSNGTTIQLPAHGRIHGVAQPTKSSQIHFDLWFPVENWNGKYVQLGQAGFAGNYNPTALAYMTARGYR